jgi:hypothetical protein
MLGDFGRELLIKILHVLGLLGQGRLPGEAARFGNRFLLDASAIYAGA